MSLINLHGFVSYSEHKRGREGPSTYVQVLPYSHIIDDSSFTSRKVEVLCIVFVVVIAKDCDFFFPFLKIFVV